MDRRSRNLVGVRTYQPIIDAQGGGRDAKIVQPSLGNLRQFAGLLALGLWVNHLGWHAAPALVAPAALVGLAAALVLRRLLAANER